MTSVEMGRRIVLPTAILLYFASCVVVVVQSISFEIATLLAFGTYVLVGTLIVVRQQGNVVGFMLVAYGTVWAMSEAALVTAEKLDEAGRVDAAAWISLVAAVASVPTLWLIAAVWLLFPDGRTESKRAQTLLWGSAVFMVVVTTAGVFASPQILPETKSYPHPFIDTAVADRLYDLLQVPVVLLFLFGYFTAAMLIVRMRHGTLLERKQAGWVAVGVIANITILLGNVIVAPLGTDDRAFLLIDSVGIVLIPLAIGVAIFRYRLYDIDVVISKSVMYLGLGLVITAIYALVVAGPLLIIGETDDGDPSLVLPIVATGVVALLFEPVRSRMQRWANRLVYGQRSSPHEVLSHVTARLSESGSDAGTSDLAKLLTEGTGAESAVVWLRRGDMLDPEGVWPLDLSIGTESVAAADLVEDELTAVTEVRHSNEVLGAVSIVKPRSDPATPADRELVADVAAGAGLLLRNIALNRQLEERARDVRESRHRLIAAQDAERHRLERDLHDGAQQQVVALKVKLGIAETLADRAGVDDVASLVSGLADETQHAVDALRAVAHGIYPPLLEAEGLEVALRAVERTSPFPMTLEIGGLGRYERQVEETVYFCVSEAIERVRMSGATAARIGLRAGDGELFVEVDHDGRVILPDLAALSDRIDAFEGTIGFEVLSDALHRIVTRLPAGERALEPA